MMSANTCSRAHLVQGLVKHLGEEEERLVDAGDLLENESRVFRVDNLVAAAEDHQQRGLQL